MMFNTAQTPSRGVNTYMAATTFLTNALLTIPMPFSSMSYNLVDTQEQLNTTLGYNSFAAVKQYFSISPDAELYLQQHMTLLPVILEARKQIQKIFFSDKLSLAMEQDENGEKKIFLYINTSLSVEEAAKRMDQLDEIWLIDHMEQLQNLVIDVRFQ